MSPDHRILFREYCAALEEARVRTNIWWADIVGEARHGSTDADAESELRRRWPRGPGTHPFIVAVVRQYFLACEELNERMRAEEEVPPHVFVGELLLAPETDRLSRIVAAFGYWPVGVDEEGRST